MYDGDYFQLMARYNRWMNQKIFAACVQIPDVDRRRDLGAFFKSIHATLDHIFYGDKAWMARFSGKPVDVELGQALHADFESLKQDRAAMDDAIVEWSRTLDEAWLREPLTYTSKVDGKTRTLPAWVLVTHLFNHQTHHRGQVTTLVKQLGYEPGVTDIPWLPDLDAVVT